MWCRTILTAVAISYVICMLLLSGLQKDDLDANTLEKLGRHNVNIDDMNNEKRRQACLLSSYLDRLNDSQKQVTSMLRTENYNEALGTPATNNSVENYVKVVEYPKEEMRVPENLEYKSVSQDKNENNKTKKIVQGVQTTLIKNSKTNDVINNSYNLENFTKIEENKGLQIEYVANKPDLQSVMNFWTKLTRYTTKVVTKIPTTPASPNISEEKNITTVTVGTSNNNGYVHSREMEYISRILAEYLASQTVSTTTQRISAKNAYINFISRRTDAISENLSDKEPNSIIPTNIIRQRFFDNLNQINNLTQFEVHPREDIDNYMTDETSNKPIKVSYESKYNQQIRNEQDTPYNQIFTVDTKTVESPKYNPIGFLDNLLHIKSENINDGVYSESETTTKGTKLINIDNWTSESFNLPIFFKYLKEVNNSNLQNIYRNQNITNENTLKNMVVKADRWEPIRNDRMINKMLNVIPIEKKIRYQDPEINELGIRKNWEQGENVGMSEQYKTAPSLNKPEQINRLKSSTNNITPNYVNEFDQIQNITLNDNRFKVIPAEMKKSKLDRNFEMNNDVFKSMLPSIKQTKRNQNSRRDNNQKDTQSELNKIEQVQNFGIYESNRTLRNQVNKKNDDEYKNPSLVADSWKPETTKTLKQNSKLLRDNQLMHMNIPALIKKYESIRDYNNQIKAIPESDNHSDRNLSFVMNTDLLAIPIDVNGLKPVQHSELNEPQVIPENIIREIAEKVKQIVLKDIGKDVTTTSIKPTTEKASPTTTTSTAVPTTTTTMKTKETTTETPSTVTKEITEANHVIQKLMEIFNEFKAMKESAKTSTQIAKTTTTTVQDTTLNYRTTKNPPLPIHTYPIESPTFNPYIKKTPVEVSPYGPSMVPVPITAGINIRENLAPQNLAQQNVFQQNLAQHNRAPPNQVPWYEPVNFQPSNGYHSGAITIQTNSDEIAPLAIQISKPVRLMNQHIIVTTKSPAEKLKEVQERESKQRIDQKYGGLADNKSHREKLKTDFTKKVRFADNLKMHDHSNRYSYKSLNKDREKPWFNHGYNSNFQHVEIFDPAGGSRYPENSNYPASFTHMENISHQRGNGHTSSYPVSKPAGFSHTTSFNRPGSHRNGITHQDRDGIRHQTGSYSYDEQDHHHPRYDTSKFHERLERIENWPRDTWREHRFMTTENCCEEIPPREQMPLTKVKQRTRFDDTHFSNFIKSQQKVTDMLEKILANNMKNSDARSVETP